MNVSTSKGAACALALTACLLSPLALSQERAGPVDQGVGELLATHICTTHGYVLRVFRPAGYEGGLNPDGSSATAPSSERVIQVEPMARQFHATWNEVSALVSNHPPHDLNYQALPANPGPGGERFCNRTGHRIPTDLTVYQVNLSHYDDFNGVTSVFSNNNAETAPLQILVETYNTLKDQGDPLPPTCPMGCVSDSGVVTDTPWGDDGAGTYTDAEGQVHEWEFGDPVDGPGTGVGTGEPPRPGLDPERIERRRGEPLPSAEPEPPVLRRLPSTQESTRRRPIEPPAGG
jgi:hypothetical protein